MQLILQHLDHGRIQVSKDVVSSLKLLLQICIIKVNLCKCRFLIFVLWHQTADSMVHGTMKSKGVSASSIICKFLINLCCSQGCECKQTVICPDTLNKRFVCVWIIDCEQSVQTCRSR